MAILKLNKPKKINSTEKHNSEYTSDSGIAGTYVPNMSKKDMLSWKAKKIGGLDPRVEIRKTIEGFDPSLKSHQWGFPNPKQKTNCYAQMLAIVRPDGSVIVSANSRMAFDAKTFKQLNQAIEEAIILLNIKEK